MRPKPRARAAACDRVLPFVRPLPDPIGYSSFTFRHGGGLVEVSMVRHRSADLRWVEGPSFVDPLHPEDGFTVTLTDPASGVTSPLASVAEALAARLRRSLPG